MPFIVDKNNFKQSLEHRIWLPANYKCLVLKKDKSVSFAGDGGEDGTLQKGASRVRALKKENPRPGSNPWHLVFSLDNQRYVLDVENGTVTAREFKPPSDAACFVPITVAGPFDEYVLESDHNKRLAVNMQDKRLTIKELRDTEPSTRIFVISDANI